MAHSSSLISPQLAPQGHMAEGVPAFASARTEARVTLSQGSVAAHPVCTASSVKMVWLPLPCLKPHHFFPFVSI